MKQRSKALLLALCMALSLTACGSFYDENAVDGLLDGHTDEEIAALESQEVAEGMLQVSINANPVFLNADAAGNLRIENAPGNPYDMRVAICLAEDGREVYASGGIKPNQHIESAALSVRLAPGDHAAVAKFYAVGKDHKDIGVVEREITLTVLE